MALEIFNCEINPLLEKFFEAPEPRQALQTTAANEDMAMAGGDDDGEVLTDDLGAPASDDKDNDLDFDNVFNVTSDDTATKTENTFSFDTPVAEKPDEDAKDENSKEEEEKKTETDASAEPASTTE